MKWDNNWIWVVGVWDINSALNLGWAILCRDIQSVVMITQLVRQQAHDLVESGVSVLDIHPTLNIIYSWDLEEISSVINSFRLQMLDIFNEQQLNWVIFRWAKDIVIWTTFESAPILSEFKITTLGYDTDLWNFHLNNVKKSSKLIRSLIKESNRRFSKPCKIRK